MQASLTRRALTSLVVGAAVSARGVARAADEDVAIALSSTSLAYGGLMIAEQGGLFPKHGLKPRIITMDSGNAATSALIGGSVQFCSSGMEEVLAARSRGQKVVIVTNLYRGISAVMVLANDQVAKLRVSPDAPAADRLKALDGMSIATPSITSGFNAPLTAAVGEYGAKITYVSIAQPAMAAALRSGAVAAFMASSPYWEPAVLQKFGTVWLTMPKPGELPEQFVPVSVAVLQTTEDYARTHPELIAKLRAVFEDAATVVKTQPDEARRLLGKAYPQVDPTTLDLAYQVNAPSWTQPTITESDIERQFRITQASGLIKGLDRVDRHSIVWPS